MPLGSIQGNIGNILGALAQRGGGMNYAQPQLPIGFNPHAGGIGQMPTPVPGLGQAGTGAGGPAWGMQPSAAGGSAYGPMLAQPQLLSGLVRPRTPTGIAGPQLDLSGLTRRSL